MTVFEHTRDSSPDAEFERRRQRAVDAVRRTTAERESTLQGIVERATTYADAPIGAISIIDRDRQWIAARVGIGATETLRSASICAQAILRPGEPLIIFDTTQDERWSSLPMIAGSPYVRFYAGIPLVNRSGYALGALCVVDLAPRAVAPNVAELGRFAREAERVLTD
jgi:GAF domain-containing protein